MSQATTATVALFERMTWSPSSARRQRERERVVRRQCAKGTDRQALAIVLAIWVHRRARFHAQGAAPNDAGRNRTPSARGNLPPHEFAVGSRYSSYAHC